MLDVFLLLVGGQFVVPLRIRRRSRLQTVSTHPIITSPQSNLRRAHRSSVDKTSTRIANNYWDRTALACCRHSKRVEPSRFGSTQRLDVCVCMPLYAAWVYDHVAFVLLRFCAFMHMNFSSTPNSILNLTIS